jgi:transcription elongation factor Elf1
MVDFVELQYATMLSNRLERFKIKSTNPYKINFRCPLCGDSQVSKTKARGWLLEDPRSQSFRYYCHNCHSGKTFRGFLKEVDPSTYNDYVASKYLDKVSSANTSTETPDNEFKTVEPKFNKSDPLKKIKKISQLKADHPVKQYIDKRQIPTNQHYRLFYAPKFMTWVNELIPNKFANINKDEPRLVIPFIDSKGKLFGFAGRGFNPNGLRYISIMLEERPKIFGLDKVDFTKKYFVVEGAIDSFFLSNAVAMAGADGNTDGLEHLENATFVFDNEPRNAEVHKMMEKIIRKKLSICIWPSWIEQKDINEMHLAGIKDIEKIIKEHTFTGLEASLKLTTWRKR